MRYTQTESFALVAWTRRRRYGRWSFWQRGTGETMMQHHCGGTEASDPVDRCEGIWACRGCGAAPKREMLIKYHDKKAWEK